MSGLDCGTMGGLLSGIGIGVERVLVEGDFKMEWFWER